MNINLSDYPENSILYRRQLTQPASEGVLIHLHGKPSHDSAPEKGSNPSSEIAELILKAEEISIQNGLQFEDEIHDYFPETRNHDDALNRVIRKAIGLKLSLSEMKDMWRASEDFGYYLKQCSGAMFYIGNGEEYPPVHTNNYDFNDRILKTAVEMFLALAEAE